MNYKEYSYNAFLALKDAKKVGGFSLYNPNENIAIYADRLGVTLVWRFNVETQTITIREMVFAQPTLLTEEDYLWLRNIAKSKHWRGGVKKIDHYRRHIGEVFLNADGIDPYFYAWMAEREYTCIHNENYVDCYTDILSEKEFVEVCKVAIDDEDLHSKVLIAVCNKKNYLPFDISLTPTKKTLSDRINEFLDDLNVDTCVRKETANKIFELLKDNVHID